MTLKRSARQTETVRNALEDGEQIPALSLFLAGRTSEGDGHEKHGNRSALELHCVDIRGIDRGASAGDESFDVEWRIAKVIDNDHVHSAIRIDLVPALHAASKNRAVYRERIPTVD